MNDKNKENVVLNEKLEKVLSKLGVTPIEEPKLAEVFDKTPLKKSSVIELLFKDTDLEIKQFKGVEIAEFFNAVKVKIFDKRLPDGTFKSTPNTENFSLPDFSQAESLYDCLVELNATHTAQDKINKSMRDGEKVKSKDIEKLTKRLTKVLSTLDDLVWEICELNKDNLTEWEQVLVSEQIFATVTEIENTSMGKQ